MNSQEPQRLLKDQRATETPQLDRDVVEVRRGGLGVRPWKSEVVSEDS